MRSDGFKANGVGEIRVVPEESGLSPLHEMGAGDHRLTQAIFREDFRYIAATSAEKSP